MNELKEKKSVQWLKCTTIKIPGTLNKKKVIVKLEWTNKCERMRNEYKK
jgi:hypothetical protein